MNPPEVTNQGCQLCSAERVTPWHFEDDECWIADCLVCSTPMVVWRAHGLPEPDLEQRLLARLSAAAAARFGDGGFWIDGARRRIPDHWHAHARPQGGFMGWDTKKSDAGGAPGATIVPDPGG